MSPLFGRGRPRSPRPDPDLLEDLGRLRGTPPRVVAHGEGPGAVVLVLVDALAVRRGTTWSVVPWQMVQTGGWRSADPAQARGRLEWTLADQSSDAVELEQPGRVPETFQERVNASIIVQQHYDVPGGGRVVIAGRRSLAPGDELSPPVWQAVTQGGARLSDPAVREFVLATTAALRADYGF